MSREAPRRVAVVTGTRAEYGLLRSVFNLSVIVPVPAIEKLCNVSDLAPVCRRQMIIITEVCLEFFLIFRNSERVSSVISHMVITIIGESHNLTAPLHNALNRGHDIIPVRISILFHKGLKAFHMVASHYITLPGNWYTGKVE